MTTVTDGSNYLVSDPSDALLFSVNEHEGARTRHHDALPAVSSTESSCVTTKAIEVCVNGVKQVIIVPLALPSNDVTTVSTLQPGYPLSSSSSAVSIDSRPDDVKLLAEACVPVTSSTVPSFVKSEVLSASTNGHGQLSAVYTTPSFAAPSAYQLFGAGHVPFSNSLVEVQRNHHSTATAQQFYGNSVRNQMPPSTVTPYLSPSFPIVSTLPAPVLPLRGFLPAQRVTVDRFVEQNNTVPLPTPPQQPFPVSFSLYYPSQVQLDVKSYQHCLPSAVTQVPWTSYSAEQMVSTSGRITDNVSLNNFYPLSQPPFNPSITNNHVASYRHFLPSLQRAPIPNFPINQPPLQDYLLRKRGIFPQYSAQVDAGNYRVPQFDPNLPANSRVVQRPLPVNTNDTRGVYQNAPYPTREVVSSYTIQSNLNSSDVNRPRLSRQLLSNGISRSVTSAVCQMTESASASVRRKSTTKLLSKNQVNNSRLPLVSSQPSHTGVSYPFLSAMHEITENIGASIMPEESDQASNSVRLLRCQPADGVAIDANPAQSITRQTTAVVTAAISACVMETTNMPVFPQISTASSHFQPLPNVQSDLQVTLSQSQLASLPAMATATSSLQTVTTCATETNCQPPAAVQLSAAAESNSRKHSELEALLFNVSSDITPGSVPSNCSLTSDPSLSNLLSTSVDLLFSASVADSDSGVTRSSVVQSGTGMGMETVSSQSGDNSNDLGSLPADMMVETAESESLLMSFCDMFEKSDTAQQHSEGVSSRPISDTVNDSFINVEQPKDRSVDASRQNYERALQYAKSLGKGQHYAQEMRERRLEQANKKRRRAKLTSLEFDDEGNSSDSWHPDSQSESSEYHSPSPAPSVASSKSQSSSYSESSENQLPSSPACSTESSKSQSSDDFVASTSRQPRTRQKTHTKSKRKKRSLRRVACAAKKRRNSADLILPCAVTKKCTVMLERLQLQGQCFVNVHSIDSLICCQRHNVAKTAPKRVLSSDSESSTAECPPIKKLKIKITRRVIEHSDSSS